MAKNKKLTSIEFALIGLGASQGAGFLLLPQAIIGTSKQDSWISAIIGLIYPLYIVLISFYIMKKHPDENILVLSKKYFGNFIGNILNVIFMIPFIFFTANITGDFVNLCRTHVVGFLTPQKIVLVGIILAAYSSYRGIKVIGKANKIIILGYLTILFSLIAIKYGNIVNIKPILGSGILNILKGSLKTGFSYYGWEILLLFHPLVKDKKAIKKYVLTFFSIFALVYVWITFITIYYLGIDILPKSYWATVMVFESIRTTVINNFIYVFMLIWILIVLRTISIYYYVSVFQINYFTKINTRTLSILIFPLLVYLSVKASDNFLRTKIYDLITPIAIVTGLIWITLIAIFSRNKKEDEQEDDKHETKKDIDKRTSYKTGIII